MRVTHGASGASGRWHQVTHHSRLLKLFLRSRSVGPAMTALVTIVVVSLTPLGDLLVPVGALTGTSDRSVAARTIVTLAAAAAALPLAEQPLAELEASARRSIRAWQWVALLSVVTLTCVLLVATARIVGSQSEPLVRNALGLTGLALLARPWWGRLGWIAPLVWVMASVLFGYQSGIGVAPWAWPIAEKSPTAWMWALAAFLIGLGSLAWTWSNPARARASEG